MRALVTFCYDYGSLKNGIGASASTGRLIDSPKTNAHPHPTTMLPWSHRQLVIKRTKHFELGEKKKASGHQY